MNDYIKILKQNLGKLYSTITSQNLYLANDRQNYTGSLLDQKILEHNNKKQLAYKQFVDCINSDFEEIKHMISKANFIDPLVIESPVAKMFCNENVKLSDYELHTFLNKANAEHNFTMLRVIKQYADRNHIILNINDALNVLDTYKIFYKSALNLAHTILSSETTVSKSLVDNFADEQFSKPLFNIIGNVLFPQQSLSDEFAHSFDDITLNN